MVRKMKIQVLVAAMHQKDHSLLDKMNIRCDAIIGNQCDENRVEQFEWNGHQISYLSFSERGVGLNRNNTLMRAYGDICLFSDDDMCYRDDYVEIIQKAFCEIPEADGIIFNIDILGNNIGSRRNTVSKRVHWYNALSYGTARLAVKTSSIKRENIAFHSCFGGGTIFSCGEDTLFIVDMLKCGLKIYTYPIAIANVDQSSSTWFFGYNKKLIHDRGVLFRAISRRWAAVLCLQDLLRPPYIYMKAGLSFGEAWKLMKQGRKDFSTLTPYKESK